MTEQHILLQKINDILPQTQCQKCDYDGCLPYAQAIVNKEAQINQCPPGGQDGINRLSELLNTETTETLTINPKNGIEKTYLEVAIIDESICIGCTLCIKACPVDSILGAAKRMHTVITNECTGCELCIAPCPVDCITMINSSYIKTIDLDNSIKQEKRDLSKYRYDSRNKRIENDKLEKEHIIEKRKKMLAEKSDTSKNSNANNDLIAQALARAQQRKQNLNK